MSYQAIACKIHTRPHPNADRIQLGNALGNQVVISLEVKDGDLGLFFPTDGQLSDEYATACKLVGYVDEAGVHQGGFFASNRRVRAQKFRGEKSDGYWASISEFAWTGANLDAIKEGDVFETLGGKPLCNKYYTPATIRAMKANKVGAVKEKSRVSLPEHIDTKQFRFFSDKIPIGSVVYLSEKMHGTSGRFGHIKEIPVLPKWKKAFLKTFSWIWGKLTNGKTNELLRAGDWRWVHRNGSRRVVLDDMSEGGFYGSHEFRYDCTKGISLCKGEILMFEIIGDLPNGKPIMGVQTIDKKQDKELFARYGNSMHYSYGTNPSCYAMYVYKIVLMNEDGMMVEMPDFMFRARCKSLGLNAVRLLHPPIVIADASDRDRLKNIVESLTDGPSTYDDRHIREGVVVRVESEEGIEYYKNKSHAFGVLEGYIKDKAEEVDLEEIS